jgi:hypothetical protein
MFYHIVDLTSLGQHITQKSFSRAIFALIFLPSSRIAGSPNQRTQYLKIRFKDLVDSCDELSANAGE